MCPFGIVATLFTSFNPDAFRTVGDTFADSGTLMRKEGGDVMLQKAAPHAEFPERVWEIYWTAAGRLSPSPTLPKDTTLDTHASEWVGTLTSMSATAQRIYFD